MSRGVQDRSKLEEEAGSGFVQCDRKTYRNKMPDQVRAKKNMNCRKKKIIMTLQPTDIQHIPTGFVQCDRKTYRNKMPDQIRTKKKYDLSYFVSNGHATHTIHSLGVDHH
jgi:hypothetical protein